MPGVEKPKKTLITAQPHELHQDRLPLRGERAAPAQEEGDQRPHDPKIAPEAPRLGAWVNMSLASEPAMPVTK